MSSKKINVPCPEDINQLAEILNVSPDVVAQLYADERRIRCWRAIFYPESLPANWFDTLAVLGIPFYLSPLHDKDLLEDGSGNLKKSHYHLVFYFTSVKSFSQVYSLLKFLNQPIPFPGDCVRGAVRYLAHMDNPEKFQYNPEGIHGYNGVEDPSIYFVCSQTQRIQILEKIMALIDDNLIYEFDDLEKLLRGDPDYYYVLTMCCTQVIRIKIDSARNKFLMNERSKNA